MMFRGVWRSVQVSVYSTDPAAASGGLPAPAPALIVGSTGTSFPDGAESGEHLTEASGTNAIEASDVYSAAFAGRLRVMAEDSLFSFRYASVGNNRVSLRTSSLAGSMRGEIPDLTEYVVGWFREGGGTLHSYRYEYVASLEVPFLFPAKRAFRLDFTAHRQNLIHFGSSFLEDVATEIHGGPAQYVEFNHRTVASAEALGEWRGAVSTITSAVVRSTTSPLVRFEAERSLARAFLRVFPWHAWTVPAELRTPRGARLREAMDFMHHNANERILPADAARAAGLSTRTLQLATARHFGMTPSAYLRTIRLQRVHEQLRDAEPQLGAVRRIAEEWGFGHLGRFAAQYGAQFGEKPSDTLRS